MMKERRKIVRAVRKKERGIGGGKTLRVCRMGKKRKQEKQMERKGKTKEGDVVRRLRETCKKSVQHLQGNGRENKND